MNVTETALVLDRMAVAYRVEVPPEALEPWSKHLASVDPDVAMDAVENVIGMDNFFPTIARFQQEVAAVHRHRAKARQEAALRGEAGPSADCPACGGSKWYEAEPVVKADGNGEIVGVFEMWKPCASCAPVEFSRWLEHKEEVKAVSRHRRSSGGHLPVTLESALAAARDALAATRVDS